MSEMTGRRPGLTGKQRAFVREYVKDNNGQAAAIRAGYSENGARVRASVLLAQSNIQAELRKVLNKVEEKAQLDAAFVLNGLQEVAGRCMQRRPVMDRDGKQRKTEDAKGELKDAWTFDSAGANRSLELLGKHLRLFDERIQHDHEITVNLRAYRDQPPE